MVPKVRLIVGFPASVTQLEIIISAAPCQPSLLSPRRPAAHRPSESSALLPTAAAAPCRAGRLSPTRDGLGREVRGRACCLPWARPRCVQGTAALRWQMWLQLRGRSAGLQGCKPPVRLQSWPGEQTGEGVGRVFAPRVPTGAPGWSVRQPAGLGRPTTALPVRTGKVGR